MSAERPEAARAAGPLIAPSVLSADPLAIAASIDALKDEYDWIHVDIMDGHFVPNLTYGPALVRALAARYPGRFLDVHIMAERAEDFAAMFAGTGASAITVHAEATAHLHRVLQSIRSAGAKPGVVLNPATPVCAIEPVLPMVDVVLVMSVNPGFGGQAFIPETIGKAAELARIRDERGWRYLIEVDGGVCAENARALTEAGCDVLVAGSAIFSAPDPAEMCRAIRHSASSR